MDTISRTITAEDREFVNRIKYGRSGGKDMRGIITDIKSHELPGESPDEFSNAPLEFTDSTKSLWDDTQIIYYHAAMENRFSENYLKLCGQLEKNIRRLGSLCLTKAVLERKGLNFPEISGLNILELVKMVSFHFRKCHAAFRGVYYDNNFIGMTYMSWEFTWFDLGNRLKATDDKIDMIRSGKINADELLSHAEKFSGEPCSNDRPDKGIPGSLRLNGSALPMDHSLARDMLGREKEAENARRREERAYRRLERELRSVGGFRPAEVFKPAKLLPEPEPEPEDETVPDSEGPEPDGTPPEEGIPEGEARRILIRDAMLRHDQISLMAIPLEDTEAVHARWMRYLERNGSGPPGKKENDIGSRKKARDKRTKKKK